MAKKTTKLDWTLKGRHVLSCNCDWGCPCNFNARPTMGFCAGVWGWIIEQGRFGGVDLSGLNIAQAAKWPGAIHEGGGTLINFIDQRAGPNQRKALTQIMNGQAGGGGPFEIFAGTSSTIHGPRFEEIRIVVQKESGQLEIGKVARSVLEPIRNPVTNDKALVRIVHPAGGFIWNEGDMFNAVECRISDQQLRFTFPWRNGTLADYEYKSP